MLNRSAHPLTAVREEMAACIKCAACMPVCPTYREERSEWMGPRGRLALAVGLLDGEVMAREGVAGPISSCIDCRACVPACPRHIPLVEVFYAAKAELALQSAGDFRAWLLRSASRLIVVGNRFAWVLPLGRLLTRFYQAISDRSPMARLLPFYRAGHKRVLPAIVRRPMTDDYPERVTVARPRGRVAFFPGCVINFTATDIGHATIRVLQQLDVEVIVPKEAPCCGIPLLSLGDQEGARKVARDVVMRYGTLDVDAVVTACASCGTTLRDTYPDLLGTPDARAFAHKVMDISEFITAHTDYRQRAGKVNETVTYHDPCHLVRGMGITEPPRRILRDVASGGLTEMDGADRCCGFGGLFSALHYDLALEVGARKAEAVADTHARTVATGCPGCQMHMTDTLARGGVPARVVHTVQVLEEALNVSKDIANKKSPP